MDHAFPTPPPLAEVLSILIPTYNRPDQLVHSLSILAPQCLAAGCHILIIDNASTVPVSGLIQTLFSEYRDIISVVRNRMNIGGNTNIARCFELCTTPWMWLLGDDDPPLQNALATISRQIEQASESCCMLNFSSAMYQNSPDAAICRFEDLPALTVDNFYFSNLLFISTNVYRMDRVRPYLSDTYHFSYSSACQLISPFLALREGAHLKNCEDLVVEWSPAPADQRWNMIYVVLGLATLADHPKLRAISNTVARHAVKAALGSIRSYSKAAFRNLMICRAGDLPFWAITYRKISLNARLRDTFVLTALSLLARALRFLKGPRRIFTRLAGWEAVQEDVSRS